MLQTRNGKRTAKAALKIACDLVDEGMRTEQEAVAMIDPRNLDTLLHPQFDEKALQAAVPIGKGLGASRARPAARSLFDAADAVAYAEKGGKGRAGSSGNISGGYHRHESRTRHSDCARRHDLPCGGLSPEAWGTCCVSGCGEIQMDEANKRFTLGGKVFTEGSEISIDGSTGKIYEGLLPTADAVIAGEFSRIMAWADKYRRLKVRTNADTPTDAKRPGSWVRRVSVFAAQSICSLKKTASRLSAK